MRAALRAAVGVGATLAALAAAASLGAAEGAGRVAAARVVDRTFRCTPVHGAVSRELDVVAGPRGGLLPRGTVTATSTGYLGVGSGVNDFAYDFVSVVSRPQERLRQPTMQAGVYVTTRRCSQVQRRAALPLSSRGLPGPPVRFDTSQECAVPGRVLVRVRAVLSRPAAWQRTGPLERGARATVVESAIAVRTERGAPLALLRLTRSGETAAWTAGTCD